MTDERVREVVGERVRGVVDERVRGAWERVVDERASVTEGEVKSWDASIVFAAWEECNVGLEDGPSRRHQCHWQRRDALWCESHVECRQEGQDRKSADGQHRQRRQSESEHSEWH